MNTTETYKLRWRSITVTIHYTPRCIDATHPGWDHIRLIAEDGQALPVSRTGYRCRFVPRVSVHTKGGPVQYVEAWLEEEAYWQAPLWIGKQDLQLEEAA